MSVRIGVVGNAALAARTVSGATPPTLIGYARNTVLHPDPTGYREASRGYPGWAGHPTATRGYRPILT